MLVNKSIETPTGTIKFEGELEQKELDFVLKIGLNTLLTAGAIPFTTKKSDTNIADGSTNLQ
jgi:hypothetical protein